MSVAISAAALSKQYRLGQPESHLRDAITRAVRSRIDRLRTLTGGRRGADSGDTIWALKDVSFTIPLGEVVGIIGRNGSGKSTLLKILSRITEPTSGEAQVRGRLGSLLEVGTGFHPELTGRENVMMNGAILGMSRAEIRAKFDAIAAFAEIDRFLDTPVKHYSSGMYVRLAFAVAAHLETDVLIVDEVLAVGDAQFQKKCLGQIGKVAQNGRTVLLVSHNMLAIESMCSRALLLDQGTLQMDGPAPAVVRTYLRAAEKTAQSGDLRAARRQGGSGEIRFTDLTLKRLADGAAVIRAGEPFTVGLGYSCQAEVRQPVFSISLWSASGACLYGIHTSDSGYAIRSVESDGRIRLDILDPNLLPGRYLLHCAVGTELAPLSFDHIIDAAVLDIEPADVYRTGKLAASGWSSVFFRCAWQLENQYHLTPQ